jgi:hypothetical protein
MITMMVVSNKVDDDEGIKTTNQRLRINRRREKKIEEKDYKLK